MENPLVYLKVDHGSVSYKLCISNAMLPSLGNIYRFGSVSISTLNFSDNGAQMLLYNDEKGENEKHEEHQPNNNNNNGNHYGEDYSKDYEQQRKPLKITVITITTAIITPIMMIHHQPIKRGKLRR